MTAQQSIVSTNGSTTMALTVYTVLATLVILILVSIVLVIGLWHTHAFQTRVKLTLQRYTVGRANSRAHDYTNSSADELVMEQNEAYTAATVNPQINREIEMDEQSGIYASVDAPNKDLVMKEKDLETSVGCTNTQIDEGDYEVI